MENPVPIELRGGTEGLNYFIGYLNKNYPLPGSKQWFWYQRNGIKKDSSGNDGYVVELGVPWWKDDKTIAIDASGDTVIFQLNNFHYKLDKTNFNSAFETAIKWSDPAQIVKAVKERYEFDATRAEREATANLERIAREQELARVTADEISAKRLLEEKLKAQEAERIRLDSERKFQEAEASRLALEEALKIQRELEARLEKEAQDRFKNMAVMSLRELFELPTEFEYKAIEKTASTELQLVHGVNSKAVVLFSLQGSWVEKEKSFLNTLADKAKEISQAVQGFLFSEIPGLRTVKLADTNGPTIKTPNDKGGNPLVSVPAELGTLGASKLPSPENTISSKDYSSRYGYTTPAIKGSEVEAGETGTLPKGFGENPPVSPTVISGIGIKMDEVNPRHDIVEVDSSDPTDKKAGQDAAEKAKNEKLLMFGVAAGLLLFLLLSQRSQA